MIGHPLVTAEQAGRIDTRAIDGGIAGTDLMESAGRGVFDAARSLAGGLRGRNVVVLCGKGNNGGDGFVVARLAHLDGARVTCLLTVPAADVQGDSRHHLDLLTPLLPVQDSAEASSVSSALADADLAVDALVGTGLRSALREPVAAWVNQLDAASCLKVAVDVPSGVNADTGSIDGCCAPVDATVTFGSPRVGHLFYPGRAACGKLFLKDIGIPEAAVDAEEVSTRVLGLAGGGHLLPHRSLDGHKGHFGRVAVVAGSQGLTGAACLTSMAALRSGAGLVTLGAPESLHDILETKLTEVMTRPLPEVSKRRCLSVRSRGEIRALFDSADAIAIGPGLGTHHETVELVRRLPGDLAAPTVFDADGLNALAGRLDVLKEAHFPVVLTPHPGEFYRLTQIPMADLAADPIGAARTLAEQTGATVVLKGAPTVVADPDGRAFVNPSGNNGMATGGSGDVLTGLIAGLMAQGMPPLDASCAGVYVHGLAGDLAAEQLGQAGMLAGDVLDRLPRAEQTTRCGADIGRYATIL